MKCTLLPLEMHHLTEAMRLVQENFAEANARVTSLPMPSSWPDLSVFVCNGLGISAWNGERMLGFMGALGPFPEAFGLPGVTGVYSPLHGHGAVADNRAAWYARLYQAAGERWAAHGATSHGVCLYAHDKETVEQFFRYGFGLRCIDAIRGMEMSGIPSSSGVVCREISPVELPTLLPLVNGLAKHMGRCPMFMRQTPQTPESLVCEAAEERMRYFAAWHREELAAYLKVSGKGESFISVEPVMRNLVGAYCLPTHRGRGIMTTLLDRVTETLRAEGIDSLGVEYESFNPTAVGFWTKYFTEYTHSVVRRIDCHNP